MKAQRTESQRQRFHIPVAHLSPRPVGAVFPGYTCFLVMTFVLVTYAAQGNGDHSIRLFEAQRSRSKSPNILGNLLGGLGEASSFWIDGSIIIVSLLFVVGL